MTEMHMLKIQAIVPLAIAMTCAAVAHGERVASFGAGLNQFKMTFVTIGHPGNVGDSTGDPQPAGSVGYSYNIGKYEVSRDMVTKANAAGGLGISLNPMTITDAGPRPDMPATGIGWNEAARFVNWLNTSQGLPPAYKFEFQPGSAEYSATANIQLWQSGDPGYNAANPFRNRHAKYFLPSADEWYKAAFYDPHADGGAGGYWDFPTGSDAAPTPIASGAGAGTAVYRQRVGVGPADITLAGGLSPYGAVGLGGNVWEWEETTLDLRNDDASSFRGLRGGDWNDDFHNMPAWQRFGAQPHGTGGNSNGFRVASVPEPSSWLLGLVGAWAIMRPAATGARRVRRNSAGAVSAARQPLTHGCVVAAARVHVDTVQRRRGLRDGITFAGGEQGVLTRAAVRSDRIPLPAFAHAAASNLTPAPSLPFPTPVGSGVGDCDAGQSGPKQSCQAT